MGRGPARVLTAACAVALLGCTSPGPSPGADPPRAPARTTTSAPVSTTASATPAPSSASPSSRPAAFDPARAMADVRRLAGEIGPRLANGPAYRRAGALVEARLRGHDFVVSRQTFAVPAGSSWGVPVRAGTSFNVVARARGFNPAHPHVLVGAHLDTVAVAPGAEDNASGVAVLLELARMLAVGSTGPQVVLVAFGAEEPRGPGDALHHFGSRHYVATMSRAERASLRGMVSLDGVGVGRSVRVCVGPGDRGAVQNALVRTAAALRVPTTRCRTTTSDHWSFEKAGYPAAKVGGHAFRQYHTARDLPSVVDARQLDRTGRVIWSWLQGR